jgi:pyruvate kinase
VLELLEVVHAKQDPAHSRLSSPSLSIPSHRYHNTGRQVLSCAEATLAGVARCAIDFSLDRDGDGVIDLSEGCVALVLTATGEAAELVAKYRPSVPVIVASTNLATLRQSCIRFGLHPLLVSAAASTPESKPPHKGSRCTPDCVLAMARPWGAAMTQCSW